MPIREFTAEDLAQHAEWLRRLARALSQAEAEAEDIAQATWERVLDGRGSSSRGLRPILARIARGLARDRRQAESRRQKREHAAARPDSWPSAEEIATRMELTERLVQALGALDECQRAVVVLRYFDGFSSAEIARRLGVPAATVRSRLKRGLDELRTRLGPKRDGGAGSSWALLAQWGQAETTTAAVAGGVGLMASVTKVGLGAAVALVVGLWMWSSGGITSVEPSGGVTTAPEPGSSLVRADREMADRSERVPVETSAAAASDVGELRAPVRRELVNAETGEALPHYAVELRDASGRTERAQSDEHGLVVTQGTWWPGPLVLRALDHLAFEELPSSEWREDQELEIDHDSVTDTAPVPCLIRVGPTYRLAMELPAETGSEDYLVELFPRGRLSGTMATGEAPLRATTELWVRFGPEVPRMRGRGPWSLGVRSNDGLWAGLAIVESIVSGLHEQPVQLMLEACGRLEGTVRTSAGPLLGESLWILMQRESDGAYPPGFAPSLDTETGTWEAEHLLPGMYKVSLRSSRLVPYEGTVRVEAGVTRQVELVVEKRANLAPIGGVLRADKPMAMHGVLVEIRAVDAFAPYFVDRVEAEGETREAAFLIQDVPPGEYELTVSKIGLQTTPETLVVRPGQTDLVLHCTPDAVERRDLILAIRDAVTAQPLRHASLDLRWAGDDTIMSADGGGIVRAASIPVDDPFEWMVSALGYVPRWGTEQDFAAGATVEVALDPGWGAELFLFADEMQPVSGVTVLLDGEIAGISDEGGRLRVVRAAAPERLTIASDEWRVQGANVDPETGEFHVEGHGVWVSLARQE